VLEDIDEAVDEVLEAVGGGRVELQRRIGGYREVPQGVGPGWRRGHLLELLVWVELGALALTPDGEGRDRPQLFLVVALLLGDAACIVPPRNANSLANAVARLLDMSSFERQALGRIARERVERNFSIDIAANKFFTLYKMLILGPH